MGAKRKGPKARRETSGLPTLCGCLPLVVLGVGGSVFLWDSLQGRWSEDIYPQLHEPAKGPKWSGALVPERRRIVLRKHSSEDAKFWQNG